MITETKFSNLFAENYFVCLKSYNQKANKKSLRYHTIN